MEEHFKNKLKNHKVDWDKEKLLGNLKQELSPEKNKFRNLWFLFIPILLLGTCWGINNLKQENINASVTMSEYGDIHDEQIVSKNNPVSENKQLLEKQENKMTKSIDNEPSKINPINESNKTKVNNSIKKIEKSNIKHSLSNKIENLKQEFKSQATTKFLPPEEMNQKKSLISSEQKFPNDFKQEKDYQKSLLPIDKTENQKNNSLPNNLADGGLKVAPLHPVANINLNKINLLFEEKNLPKLKESDYSMNKTKVENKNPFYISASGDIGLLSRSRTFNVEDPEFEELLIRRDKSETSLFAFSTSINFGYQHKTGLSLQSGLEYSVVREVFNYNKINEETTVTVGDQILYYVVQETDTLFVKDTTKLIRTEERVIKHYNKHTFYSIPILLGYEVNLKKAKLVGRLGISYTFGNSFNGRMNILTELEEGIIYEPNLDFKFQLKNRIGLQAGLAIEYPFLKNSQIVVSANYRRSPKLAIDVVEQNYQTISLGLGIKVPVGKIK